MQEEVLPLNPSSRRRKTLTLYRRTPHIPPAPDPIPFSTATLSPELPVLTSEEASFLDKPIPENVLGIAKKHGRKVAFEKRGKLNFLLTSPEAAECVLVTNPHNFLKGPQERVMASAIGWGLIVEEGQEHKRQQRALSPALRGSALDTYTHSITALASAAVQEVIEKRDVDLNSWTRSFSQQSAERALFGQSHRKVNLEYQSDLNVLNQFAMWGLDEASNPDQLARNLVEFRDAQRRISQYVDQLVSNLADQHNSPENLLSLILSDENSHAPGLSGVRSQVAVFLQASVETTASLVAWAILCLDQNPQYREPLRLEAQLSSSGASRSYRDFGNLALHSAVINEALRLHPPAWMFPRTVQTEVSVDGIRLEPGTEVLLSPWVTHRDEALWADPEKFLPDRWLGASSSPVRGAFFPFGMGSRVCIGERYARLTAAILLKEISQQGCELRVQVEPGAVPICSLIAMPSEGTRVQVA